MTSWRRVIVVSALLGSVALLVTLPSPRPQRPSWSVRSLTNTHCGPPRPSALSMMKVFKLVIFINGHITNN